MSRRLVRMPVVLCCPTVIKCITVSFYHKDRLTQGFCLHLRCVTFFAHLQCYYIGASDISATKLVREVTKPLSFGKPVEKICEDLKKKDEQICELRYGKSISVSMVVSLWSV